LGPQLKSEQSAIHADLISNCMDRLRVSHDNLTILRKCEKDTKRESEEKNSDKNDKLQNCESEDDEKRADQLIAQILRVLIVLREYLNEFDANYLCERIYLPLNRY
jgi:ubiquitin carboxyl-terminal hydrolase 9/24